MKNKDIGPFNTWKCPARLQLFGTPRAESPAVESTRIIPLSSPTSRTAHGQQPANVIRMEPDPDLIKLEPAKGRDSGFGGDSEITQRFASEVSYVTYYAQRLADTLGMHQLQFGIIEDREGQTAFIASSGGWHGSISGNRRSLRNVKETLARG